LGSNIDGEYEQRPEAARELELLVASLFGASIVPEDENLFQDELRPVRRCRPEYAHNAVCSLPEHVIQRHEICISRNIAGKTLRISMLA
jgi:hypothetical protein